MFLLGLYFQRTIACLLLALSFPNALGALVASGAEASSISTSISPKSIREKNTSPNEIMNSTTLEASDDVSGNVTSSPTHIVKNLGASNVTGESPIWLLNIRSGALERTGYVVLGIMSLLLFVFVIRAIRVTLATSKILRKAEKVPDKRSYVTYTESQLQEAANKVKFVELSCSAVSRNYNVPHGVIQNKLKGCHTGKVGAPIVLSEFADHDFQPSTSSPNTKSLLAAPQSKTANLMTSTSASTGNVNTAVPVSPSLLSCNQYVIVKFSSNTNVYFYVCVIQALRHDEQVMVDVLALQSVKKSKNVFHPWDNSVSHISYNYIVELLPYSKLICHGDRVKYEFS